MTTTVPFTIFNVIFYIMIGCFILLLTMVTISAIGDYYGFVSNVTVVNST